MARKWHGLTSKHDVSVPLGDLEDVSFWVPEIRPAGIGSLDIRYRLSTAADEFLPGGVDFVNHEAHLIPGPIVFWVCRLSNKLEGGTRSHVELHPAFPLTHFAQPQHGAVEASLPLEVSADYTDPLGEPELGLGHDRTSIEH